MPTYLQTYPNSDNKNLISNFIDGYINPLTAFYFGMKNCQTNKGALKQLKHIIVNSQIYMWPWLPIPVKNAVFLLETNHCGVTMGLPRERQQRNFTVLRT